MANRHKTYPTPWNGKLILACRKCQKKMKGQPGIRGLAKLKKTIERRNEQHPDQALHVINVPCMDLCPKNGVTVCNPALEPVHLSILRSEEDLATIFANSKAKADRTASVRPQEVIGEIA